MGIAKIAAALKGPAPEFARSRKSRDCFDIAVTMLQAYEASRRADHEEQYRECAASLATTVKEAERLEEEVKRMRDEIVKVQEGTMDVRNIVLHWEQAYEKTAKEYEREGEES